MELALPVRPKPGIGSCNFTTPTVSPKAWPVVAAPGHTTSKLTGAAEPLTSPIKIWLGPIGVAAAAARGARARARAARASPPPATGGQRLTIRSLWPPLGDVTPSWQPNAQTAVGRSSL